MIALLLRIYLSKYRLILLLFSRKPENPKPELQCKIKESSSHSIIRFGKMSTKERSGSESTAEMSLTDDILEIGTTKDYAGMTIDIVQRHDIAAKALIRKVEAHFRENEEVFSIRPVLLADNVTEDILEMIPSLVGNYKVKCMVKNRQLWLVSLSSGEYHATAVLAASAQTFHWVELSRGFFTARSDGNTPFSEEDAAAPDAVILISRNRINRRSSAVLVIEVEFSHRSIQGMRRDFLQYFNGPDVVSVVGIKFFPDGQSKFFSEIHRNYLIVNN